MAISTDEICGVIEAILYVAGEPLPVKELLRVLEIEPGELEEAVSKLEAEYEGGGRGLKLNRFGGGLQLSTRPEYASYIEALLQPVKRQSLSQAVMETLSIIAYRQPITRAEIEAVRGVKSDYSLQSLLGKGLIEVKGQKDTVGHPLLYGTTDVFLQHFGISSLEQLPELARFSAEEVLKEPLD